MSEPRVKIATKDQQFLLHLENKGVAYRIGYKVYFDDPVCLTKIFKISFNNIERLAYEGYIKLCAGGRIKLLKKYTQI